MTDTLTQAHKREAAIEAHLVERIAALGGIAYKFTSPARRSVPDRVVLLPKRDDPDSEFFHAPATIFVELKAPGCKPTPGQAREHERIRALGHRVEVLDSVEAVDAFVEGLR